MYIPGTLVQAGLGFSKASLAMCTRKADFGFWEAPVKKTWCSFYLYALGINCLKNFRCVMRRQEMIREEGQEVSKCGKSRSFCSSSSFSHLTYADRQCRISWIVIRISCWEWVDGPSSVFISGLPTWPRKQSLGGSLIWIRSISGFNILKSEEA